MATFGSAKVCDGCGADFHRIFRKVSCLVFYILVGQYSLVCRCVLNAPEVSAKLVSGRKTRIVCVVCVI